MEAGSGLKVQADQEAEPLPARLSSLVVEHDGAGSSAVHALGQASVGIGSDANAHLHTLMPPYMYLDQ
jgi:hypothetical protein